MSYKIKKTTTFYSPVELYETIRTLAMYERRSMSNMVVNLIIEALIERKKNLSIQELMKDDDYFNELELEEE